MTVLPQTIIPVNQTKAVGQRQRLGLKELTCQAPRYVMPRHCQASNEGGAGPPRNACWRPATNLQRKTRESNSEQALQKLPFGASFKKRLLRGTRAMPPRTLGTSPTTGRPDQGIGREVGRQLDMSLIGTISTLPDSLEGDTVAIDWFALQNSK
jgi:hypothetical protein